MTRTLRNSRRSRRPQLLGEHLETRGLLSVGFPTGITTVSDQAGFATISLANTPDNYATMNPTPPATQAYLSFGAGTAVPGVDYTPVNQTVSFAAGQNTTTVQVPVLPGNPSEGSRIVELDLSPAPGAPP